jgi:hypothetical protein
MSRASQTAGCQMIRVGSSHSTPYLHPTFVFFALLALLYVAKAASLTKLAVVS